MAARAATATFTGFDPYKLTGVRVTDRKLGHGSYATVLELEYMGLKCAGKKIHELLLEQGDAQRRSATPSFMTWLWACATSTAKLLPSFTEISLPTMSSSPPT